MKRLPLFLLLLTTAFGVLQAETRHYVKAGNPVNGNGLSWATASGDLQAVICDVASGDSVFVVAGTYKPAPGAYFYMKAGVKIYRSFAGGESDLATRNLTGGYTSILHGNGASVIRNDGNGLDASAVLDGFTITGGAAQGIGDNRQGSGIYNKAVSPTFNSLTISANSTADASGGGMYNDLSSSPILTDATVTGNTATSYGGGIFTGNGSVISTNTTTTNNTAGQGDGMLNQPSSIVLANAIISGNTAGMGGGIYNNINPSATLTNVTIAANKATNTAGGIYNSAGSQLTLLNSIILGNSTAITGNIFFMTHSLVQGLSNKLNGNIDATGLNTTDIFTNFAGGDYVLNKNSLAINRGTPDVTGLNLRLTDVAGNRRVQKGTVDMGAYESPYDVVIIPDSAGIVYVTLTGTGNFCGDSWSNATTDVQRAINATGVAQVWVAGGTYQPASGQFFAMAPGVKIYGGFTGTEERLAERDLTNGDTSILKGNGTSVIRNENNGLDTSAVLDGFKVTGGNAEGIDEGGNGGGIYNHLVSPLLRHLTITGNTASYGGNGIANVESSPVLDDVILRGNETEDTYGGGMYNNYSFPVLTHVIISGNTAYDGGGMYNEYYSCPVLTNVLINNNTAIGHGGGMENNQISNPVLTNVTISGNTANVSTFGSGGGIYNLNSAVPELTNCVLWGNEAGGEANEVNNSYGSSTTLHYSLYANGVDDITGSNMNVDNSITDAPLFADAANGDYRLSAGSPAINAGDNAANAAILDLAGNPRIFGTAIDMGAYESQEQIALPVTIESFTGVLQNDMAALEWQSGIENNMDYYTLEKSTDGKVYHSIATITSKGSNDSYTYSTRQQETSAMYRLKWTDNSGHREYYHRIVSLTQGGAAIGILVYPNPARDYINIRVAAPGNISIYDAAGRLVKTQALSAGVNNIDIHSMSAGVYYAVVHGQRVQFLKH